ncbi:MAG: TIGR03621 family F420-dependent LLM class oxidoreductase [Acidimicrobiia bacterium]
MPHDRKFRFGVLAKQARPASEFRDLARQAEDLGFSTFFMPDHFVDHPLAPIPGIMAAAAATTTLRVGTLVLGNDYKHPVVLANEAATIDLLSDGRLELGVGAGWMTEDYERGGFTLDSAGVRIARLDESLTVMKGLMADGPFSFHGEHYQVDALDGEPKPVQRPHPPIVVGGGGPKVLALAAKHAQIVGINANLSAGTGTHPDSIRSLTAEATDEKLESLRAAAGDRFAELEIQTLTGLVIVTDDRQPIADGIASAFGVPVDVALETPAVLVGSAEQIVEDLEARRARWQMSYVVVPEEFVDAMAPVVAQLAGR